MTYDKTISSDKLNDLIQTWAINTFGIDFKFRPSQKETIHSIIWNWLNDTSDVILDAPTGSGKSIIAMIVAGVLADYFGKRGYILISDLSLLEQYQNDINIYLPAWGVIRGQQTYTCLVNNLNFRVGACKVQGCKSYAEILANFGDCAPYCEYLVDREKAINAKVTVCTYTHWLLQQNYVKPKLMNTSANIPFDTRDFVICDEAHKLVGIVQNHFSPKFGKNDISKISNVINASPLPDKGDMTLNVESLRRNIYAESDKSKLFEMIKEYTDILCTLSKNAEKLKGEVGGTNTISEPFDEKHSRKKLSKADKILIYDCDFVTEHCSKFIDYVNIIEKIGTDYIVKNDSAENDITFNCLNESYLMHRTFHANCGKKLYMSATIGDPATFAREAAFTKYQSYKLPIVFDYTNSPIFYVPDYKMSYTEKEASFPAILQMITKILTMYPNYRGIIQTGSYAFAKRLYESIDSSLKKRILLYEDSAGKQDNLETYKYSTNKILVGPSLVEGLSLNDDLCRFQIIMKIPYPSLADKFISAKRDFNPRWYAETTSISILQGVGRGVRNEHDWCVTFILDGCFNNLLRDCKSMFPNEFLNRIQVIPSASLM